MKQWSKYSIDINKALSVMTIQQVSAVSCRLTSVEQSVGYKNMKANKWICTSATEIIKN